MADKTTFNFTDNSSMMQEGVINDSSMTHPYYQDFLGLGGSGRNPRSFVEDILNTNIPYVDQPGFIRGTPYNNSTFILLSAGPDGMFGSKDDVWNIPKK